MPHLITSELKNTELYFDLRPGGMGEPEGFWAVPLFESMKRRIAREAVAKGRDEAVWVEYLKETIRNWEGFRNMKGEEIPCTPETVASLCESDPGAMYAIFSKILDAGRQAQKNAEKN